MATLTTFIAGSGPVALEVRSLVESWTRAGIVGPSLWVMPEDVVTHPTAPPRVAATHVHAGGTDRVDLFEHIGTFRLDLVRLVVAHLFVHDVPADLRLVETAGVVSKALNAALPRRANEAVGSRDLLHRSLVVIPESGVADIDSAILEPQWNLNVVISPEDRPDLDRANVFVRYPGNFVGHAAAALSAVGGIVRGVGEGALDDLDADSTTQDNDVRVIRLTVRSVIGEDGIDELLAQILNPAGNPFDQAVQLLSWARPASQPDSVSTSAARHLLSAEEWAPRPMPIAANNASTSESFKEALTRAITFNVKTCGAVLSWALTLGRARAERGLTSAITGDNAGVLVRLGPRPIVQIEKASKDLIEQERALLDSDLKRQSTRVSSPPSSTWTKLRKLGFSLVDGGDLDGFPEPMQANRRELLPPAYFVPAPDSHWIDRDEQRIDATDPVAMKDYQRRLDVEVATAKGEVLAAKLLLDAAVQALQDASQPPTAIAEGSSATAAAQSKSIADSSTESHESVSRESETKPTAPGTQTRKPSKKPDKVAAAVKECETRLTEMQGALTAWEDERESYKSWFDEAAKAITWKVAEDVGRRSAEFKDKIDKLEKYTENTTPPTDHLKRAQRILRATWIVTLLTWLVLSLAVVAVRYNFWWLDISILSITTLDMIYALVALFLALAIVLGLANHAFYKAMRRYEWAVRQRIANLRTTRDSFVFYGQEKSRLDFLYGALAEWTRLLGELVHQPWGALSSDYEDLNDELVDAFPASMGVARQPGHDVEIPVKVLIEATSIVYPRGWLSRVFDAVHDRWEDEQGARSDEGYRAVDLDTSTSSQSPRSRLMNYFASGEGRRTSAERVRSSIRAAVLDGSLVLPDRVVRRVGRFGDGKTYPEPDFYAVTATENIVFSTELFSASAAQKRLHYVDRSVSWAPASSVVRDGESLVEHRICDGPTAVRVDISRRLPAAEITVFARPTTPLQLPDSGHPSVTDDESPKPGWY